VSLTLTACDSGHSRPTGLPEPRPLSFTTEDGVRIAATLYPVEGASPPGVVFLHGRGADRSAWTGLATRAQRDGMMSLAFDARGHGESTAQGTERLNHRRFDDAAWAGLLKDLAAAKQALVAEGADQDNIAIVGAEIGANAALLYALEDEDIQGVVMVSPGLNYKGLDTADAIAACRERPVFLMTAENDAYSAASCATLKEAAEGFCELRAYPGSAQGTDIFVGNPSAMDQVLMWLALVIGPGLGATGGAS
jgi:dienelactone hydrolase